MSPQRIGYAIVQVPGTGPSYTKKNDLSKEYEAYTKLRINVNYVENSRVSKTYTCAILEFPKQATSHPTKQFIQSDGLQVTRDPQDPY